MKPRSAPCPSPRRHRAVASIVLMGIGVAGLGGLSACSWVPPVLSPNFNWTYKIDIQQGVVVTQEMAAQLRPGMTFDQVKFIMGSPPLTDPYHASRWDYPFVFIPGRGPVEARRFTVFFENDRMVRAEGDPLPTEKEFVASRIRINRANAKALPEPAVNAVAPKPGTGEDSGAAPTQPASTGIDPQAAGNGTGSTPDSIAGGPTIWQRVTGLFGSPAKNTAPAAPVATPAAPTPAPPADPASAVAPDAH